MKIPAPEHFVHLCIYLMSSAFIRQIYQVTLCGTEVGRGRNTGILSAV